MTGGSRRRDKLLINNGGTVMSSNLVPSSMSMNQNNIEAKTTKHDVKSHSGNQNYLSFSGSILKLQGERCWNQKYDSYTPT